MVMKRLRNVMLAGLVALLPLYLTVTLLLWLFQTVDGFFRPLVARFLGIEVGGVGVLATVVVVFVAGVLASSVTGAMLVRWVDRVLDRVPLIKGLYRGIKRIVDSFNPSNPSGFKEFVLVRQGAEGFAAGFLTSEFRLVQSDGTARDLATVFIPSNHLYLGAIHIVDRGRIVRTSLTLQDGVTFALSAGSSVQGSVSAAR